MKNFEFYRYRLFIRIKMSKIRVIITFVFSRLIFLCDITRKWIHTFVRVITRSFGNITRFYAFFYAKRSRVRKNQKFHSYTPLFYIKIVWILGFDRSGFSFSIFWQIIRLISIFRPYLNSLISINQVFNRV